MSRRQDCHQQEQVAMKYNREKGRGRGLFLLVVWRLLLLGSRLLISWSWVQVVRHQTTVATQRCALGWILLCLCAHCATKTASF